jgi:hypothetical protein
LVSSSKNEKELIFNFSKAYSKLYPIESSANIFDQLTMSKNPAVNSTLNSNSSNEYSLIDPNKIHLFVKAGQDGSSVFYFYH